MCNKKKKKAKPKKLGCFYSKHETCLILVTSYSNVLKIIYTEFMLFY